MTRISGDNFSQDASPGKKYALVVGVNQPKVRILPALRYAESDATGIGYLLGRKACNFAFPSGVLIGEAASTQNVRRAINYLIEDKSANDLLLFYFIGHGYPVETAEEKAETYLVTSDFDPHQAEINPSAYLSLNEIQKTLYERQNAANIVIILDCSHTGHIIESHSPAEKQLMQSLEEFATNIRNIEQLSTSSHRSWAILASTEQGTTAYEHINDRNEGHALMTGLILDALNGNARNALDKHGNLTLQTLHLYLQTQMKRLDSGKLYPIMQGTFHNPVILAHHPSENPVLRSPNDYPQFPSRQPFDMDISQATFADLDLEQVRTFLKNERVQIQRDYRSDPDEQAQMQALGLLRGEHPRYAALLCFGRDPSHQIAGAYTRCTYWSDTKRLSGWEDDREFWGSLLQQFTQACDFLRSHLHFSRVIERSGSHERPEIPFRVLEEALANALMHREYVTESDHTVRTEGVQVEIFADRVEITSPGGAPAPLDRKSHPRNPQIMRIFYLAGYVGNLGTGIKRMEHLMQEADLRQPAIRSDPQTFTITLFRPTLSLALLTQTDASTQDSQRTSQTQVPSPPSPTENQEVFHDFVALTPQLALHQSDSDKRPLLAKLHAFPIIIVVVILALVAGVYFWSKQDYLLTPMLRFVPASTTITIASDFPTSGLDKTGGLPLQNGVQMAITEANHAHLLPGYTLKLVPYDDVGINNRRDPQKGANNLKQAIADNLVAGVIGPYNSSVALKELPLTNQAPLAQLSPSTTFPCLTKSVADDPACTEINDIATQMRPTSQLTFLRLATTDDRQSKATADYFFQTKHYSKVLLLKDGSALYSSSLAQAFQTEWQGIGGLVISVDLPQNTSGSQDYQKALQLTASQLTASPDLIYFAGSNPNGSYVLKALSNIATLKTVPFAGGDGIMESSFLQIAANSHYNAPIYASLPIQDPAHSGIATGTNFEANYIANGYQDYRPYAAAAYDCARILIQAIKQALQNTSTPHGRQDHAGAVQFRQAVLQALRQPFSYTGATGTHSFDANGDTINHTISFYQANLSTPPLSWTWLQQVNA